MAIAEEPGRPLGQLREAIARDDAVEVVINVKGELKERRTREVMCLHGSDVPMRSSGYGPEAVVEIFHVIVQVAVISIVAELVETYSNQTYQTT